MDPEMDGEKMVRIEAATYRHTVGPTTALNWATLTKRRGKDHPEADSQRAAHVEELLAGSTHGHGGQASHDACGVPGRPDHQRAAQQSEGSNDGTHHTFNRKHNSPFYTAHFGIRSRRGRGKSKSQITLSSKPAWSIQARCLGTGLCSYEMDRTSMPAPIMAAKVAPIA